MVLLPALLVAPLPGAAMLLGFPAAEGEELWVDAETLRYSLAEDWGLEESPAAAKAFERLLGARITRVGGNGSVAVHFDGGFELELATKERARSGSLYQIHVPRTVRFTARFESGWLRVEGLDAGRDPLTLSLKLAWLPDRLWARSLLADPASGRAWVRAGVLGNQASVTIEIDLFERKVVEVGFREPPRPPRPAPGAF